MELDADCLYEARPENVERLARSLGVRLPPHRGRDMTYNRKLVRLVLKHLELILGGPVVFAPGVNGAGPGAWADTGALAEPLVRGFAEEQAGLFPPAPSPSRMETVLLQATAKS